MDAEVAMMNRYFIVTSAHTENIGLLLRTIIIRKDTTRINSGLIH
jgi:hypothetical protein